VTALYVVSAFAVNRIMAFIEKRVRSAGLRRQHRRGRALR
jgi:hypothetical protein